jgi:hypothetical protein
LANIVTGLGLEALLCWSRPLALIREATLRGDLYPLENQMARSRGGAALQTSNGGQKRDLEDNDVLPCSL